MQKILNLIFTSKKEIVYPEELVLNFRTELYLLLDSILSYSFDRNSTNVNREKMLAEHIKLLKLEIEKGNVYEILIDCYFKLPKEYSLSYALERDLVDHARSFKNLRDGLKSSKYKMYYQKSYLKFKEATIGLPRLESFYDFFITEKKEIFVYNQKIALHITKNSIRVFSETFSVKAIVITFKVILEDKKEIDT